MADVSSLTVLSYFNVFNHPLTAKEIGALISKEETDVVFSLTPCIQAQKCFEHNGYYGLNSTIEEDVKNRIIKEKRAKAYFKKLPFYTRLIKRFPFVRGVAISGSLSKGVMHEDGDIDYFIITKHNRLWICRTLLIIFKKVVLLNSRKYFCVNYFVDEGNLEIHDKNIFTAVEVTHLLPVYGKAAFQRFKRENSWTKNYFKNYSPSIQVRLYNDSSNIQKILESFIWGTFAEKLDLFFMRVTCKRWAKKFGAFDAQKFELTMRSHRGISKHHPSDFQNKVLEKYESQLKALNLQHESSVLS